MLCRAGLTRCRSVPSLRHASSPALQVRELPSLAATSVKGESSPAGCGPRAPLPSRRGCLYGGSTLLSAPVNDTAILSSTCSCSCLSFLPWYTPYMFPRDDRWLGPPGGTTHGAGRPWLPPMRPPRIPGPRSIGTWLGSRRSPRDLSDDGDDPNSEPESVLTLLDRGEAAPRRDRNPLVDGLIALLPPGALTSERRPPPPDGPVSPPPCA